MSEAKFEQTMKMLLEEYEKSDKTVDDFVQSKLEESGMKDVDAYVKELDATLDEIDKNYESLQEFKKNGHNREEWLKGKVDEIGGDYSPEEVGKVLHSTTRVLNGESDDTPDDDASYDGIDAAIAVRKLDDALVKNTCTGLNTEVK